MTIKQPRKPASLRVLVTMDEETKERAKIIGYGNLSLGIRIAVKRCRIAKQDKENSK